MTYYSTIITILPSNSIPFGKSSSHRALTRWHFLSVGPASKPTEMHPLMQQYLGSVGSCWGWKNPKPSFLGVISYNPYFGVQNLHFPWVVGVQGLVLLLDIFLVPVEVERLKSYYLPGFYTSQVVWNRPDFFCKNHQCWNCLLSHENTWQNLVSMPNLSEFFHKHICNNKCLSCFLTPKNMGNMQVLNPPPTYG